jgi:hypothetical protein
VYPSQVSDWCDGDIRTEQKGQTSKEYIKVQVQRPLSDRQTKAFVGDWVLASPSGYKVYTDKNFAKMFRPVSNREDTLEDALNTMEKSLGIISKHLFEV